MGKKQKRRAPKPAAAPNPIPAPIPAPIVQIAAIPAPPVQPAPVSLYKGPPIPPITTFLASKVTSRRIRWIGFRKMINFSTFALFTGLLYYAPAPVNGREDFVFQVSSPRPPHPCTDQFIIILW